jgi:hypothetical protein
MGRALETAQTSRCAVSLFLITDYRLLLSMIRPALFRQSRRPFARHRLVLNYPPTVGVAQLVERRTVAPNVEGSNPFSHPKILPNARPQVSDDPTRSKSLLTIDNFIHILRYCT